MNALNALNPNTDPKTLGKVAVLMGGVSDEREVSLRSGQAVLAALQSQGVNAHAFDTGQRSLYDLVPEGFQRCFIALHGRFGEDGTVQGLLELLGIPYTGSGVMASSMCIDKAMAKRLWREDGIPAPAACIAHYIEDVEDAMDRYLSPLIVKPLLGGSSIGLSKIYNKEESAKAFALAAGPHFKLSDLPPRPKVPKPPVSPFAKGVVDLIPGRIDAPSDTVSQPSVLCERFIEGAEYTCAILGTGRQAYALPMVRIEPGEGGYNYQNKYFSGQTRYHIPCGLAPIKEEDIQSLCLKAYHSMGCRGWARIDVLIDDLFGQPYLLEINTVPGMTEHSLFPMAAQAGGISYAQLCVQLLAAARLDHAPIGQAHTSPTSPSPSSILDN